MTRYKSPKLSPVDKHADRGPSGRTSMPWFITWCGNRGALPNLTAQRRGMEFPLPSSNAAWPFETQLKHNSRNPCKGSCNHTLSQVRQLSTQINRPGRGSAYPSTQKLPVNTNNNQWTTVRNHKDSHTSADTPEQQCLCTNPSAGATRPHIYDNGLRQWFTTMVYTATLQCPINC